MKKTTLSFIFFILLTFNVNAQRWGVPNLREYDFDNVHFGFLLGMNQMGFCVKQNFDQLYDIAPTLSPKAETGLPVDSYLTSVIPSSASGFTIGVTSSFKITDNFYFRFTPALVLGSGRSINYSLVDIGGKSLVDANGKSLSQIKTLNSTLIELPLILRFQGSRIQNTEPFVQAGLKYTYNFSGTEENPSVLTAFPLKLKKNEIYGVFGLGFNFYFDWFKMGVEGSMNYGFQDILDRSGANSIYKNGITSLKSKYFQLSVTFE